MAGISPELPLSLSEDGYKLTKTLSAAISQDFKNLMLIHDTNPKRAESIAEFWTTKAQRECLDYLNNQLDLIMVKFKAIKDITEEQKIF